MVTMVGDWANNPRFSYPIFPTKQGVGRHSLFVLLITAR